MVFDLSKVTGISDYTIENTKAPANGEGQSESRTLYRKGSQAFLVVNKNTIEVRSDARLSQLLVEQYESVMPSRYFGTGGIEIVLAGSQLSEDEVYDLVRLSYNLTD